VQPAARWAESGGDVVGVVGDEAATAVSTPESHEGLGRSRWVWGPCDRVELDGGIVLLSGTIELLFQDVDGGDFGWAWGFLTSSLSSKPPRAVQPMDAAAKSTSMMPILTTSG